MFTIEVRINGRLITHVYGYNAGCDPETDAHFYDVDIYKPESKKFLQVKTSHMRIDGIDILAAKILAEIPEKEKEQLAVIDRGDPD